MTITLHEFADPETLAETLAIWIAKLLTEACETKGEAVLAVSGGTTPVRLFETLSRQAMPWDKVTVTLVDERFVPVENARSNERLVTLKLLQNKASKARFVGLHAPAGDADTAATIAGRRIAALKRPFDAVILGMGTDGHTASFFPDGDRLADATDPACTALVLPMNAPDAGEPRLTLTLPVILEAGFVALHIEGEKKKAVFEKARLAGSTAEMPVRSILNSGRPVEVFWAP